MRFVIIYIVVFLFLTCCNSPKSEMQARFEYIDSLIYAGENELADKVLCGIKSKDLSDERDKALFYLLKFQNDFVLDKVSETDSLIDFCIDYFKSNDDCAYFARSCYYKGGTLLFKDRVKEALHFIKMAEDAELKANIPWLRHLICNNMSLINIYLGANQAAFEYARKSLNCAIENDNIPWLCGAYNSLALCFYQIGRKDSAEFYLDKTLPYINKVEGREFRSVLLTNIGVIYYDNKMYRKADSLFRQALVLLPDPNSRINLAKTCYMLDDAVEGDSLFNVAWPEASAEEKAEILQFRAEEAERNGLFSESARYYKSAQAMQDSIRRGMKTEEAVSAQHGYEQERYKADVGRRAVAVGAMVLAAVVLIVLAIVAYYRKRINRAKRTITEGNRLIAEYTARISELEKQDAGHADKVRELKRKIRTLRDGQAAVLGGGQRLYDDIAGGGTTAMWKKKDFDEFIEFYRLNHAAAVASAENDYSRLSSTNIFYLLLVDMERGESDIQRIMCLTDGALRTMKSRIKAKRIA